MKSASIHNADESIGHAYLKNVFSVVDENSIGGRAHYFAACKYVSKDGQIYESSGNYRIIISTTSV